MAASDEPTPMSFASYEDYWAVRHDESTWAPWFRWALKLAGLPAQTLTVLQPSQYPTARCGPVIVTIYPHRTAVFDLECEALTLLGDQGLPTPRLIASGAFPAQEGPLWHWLVESVVQGVVWSSAGATAPPAVGATAAKDTGALLSRLHDIDYRSGRAFQPDWGDFDELIHDELQQLGRNDARLELFPEHWRASLHALARSTVESIDRSTAPVLLHGDIHANNVFIDPSTGHLSGLVDLNEMHVGDGWYDVADGVFRLLEGRPGLTRSLLQGYGVNAEDSASAAVKLLGWGLLHDFDGLSPTLRARGLPPQQVDLQSLAMHLTGLA